MTTETQTAPAVLMIRPCRVPANPQTAATNAFQQTVFAPTEALLDRVRKEFTGLETALRSVGIKVYVFDDTDEPETPDAVFPNNWITTHADGRVVLYPMLAENRRTERRHDVVEALSGQLGYDVKQVVDYSSHELQNRILEGTGSMILDRVNRIAYACLSPRTDDFLLNEFCRQFNYEAFSFHALDRTGQAIYHTNVMMAVGTHFATVCTESISDLPRRAELIGSLQRTGHDIVDISFSQMEQFAGNMLELDAGDTAVIAMSQRAYDTLDTMQRKVLSRHATLVSAPIDTIEDCAGGSVRCMLAEIFLPETQNA